MAELLTLSVDFISLVKTPATGKGLVLKSAQNGQRPQVFSITKMIEDRMVAYGVVYAPGQIDSQGDHAGADAIRKAAYEFMREKRVENIDAEHSFNSEQAYVAESWLVRKGDELFGEEPEGAWAVGIQVADPDIWNMLKSGELTGLSLAGVATTAPSEPRTQWAEKDDQAPGWFASFVKSLSPQTFKETPMNKDEVRAIVREEVGPAVTQALKSAGLIEEAPPATPPGASSEPADLEKAVAAAVAKGLEGLEAKIDDAVTKSLAKGAGEAGTIAPQSEETFA